MGREVRKVIANWDHPKRRRFSRYHGGWYDEYIPMVDRSYGKDLLEYENDIAERGIDCPDCQEDREDCECGNGPPNPKSYRPDWDPKIMIWFQIYETVSEGTPVTPPFATKEELVNYLVDNGDFWDQTGWSRKNAEGFVKRGFALSGIVVNGQFATPRDQEELLSKTEVSDD